MRYALVWIVEKNGERCENGKTLSKKPAKDLRDELTRMFPENVYVAKPNRKGKK